MKNCVALPVVDLEKAVEYYGPLLAVVEASRSDNQVVLADEHLELTLKRTDQVRPADVTLNVTPGMLARILDAAMTKAREINVDSPEQVRFSDVNGHRWTVCCRIG